MSAAAEREVTAASSHRLFCLVCDARSRHSTAVAHEAERLGVAVVRTNGDITDFWFNDLAQRWKTAPVAIAGLTAHGPLFCLEHFAWDHGLRVVFRGAHRFHHAGHVEHSLTGPRDTVASAPSALTGDDWPAYVARLLSSCAVTRDTASVTVRSTSVIDLSIDIDDTLYSWVIASKEAIERRL